VQAPSPLVRLENVGFAYAKNGNGLRVVDKLLMEILNGEVLGIYGGNGSAKSTLLNLLAGFYEPSEGTISFASGSNPATAYLTQDFAATLLPWFKGRTNLLLPLRYAGVPLGEAEQTVSELVEDFAPNLDLEKYTHQMSGGQQQILGLLRCFAALLAASHKSALALLDEPWSAVNFQRMLAMRPKLTEWAKRHGVTVVIASHNLDDLPIACSRVLTVVGPPLRVVCEVKLDLPHPRKQLDLAGPKLMEAKAQIYGSLEAA
jgi:NitT/TauT family transport system ATP-binding protein